MTNILRLYPDCGFYRPGSPVRLRLDAIDTSEVTAVFRVIHLGEQVEEITVSGRSSLPDTIQLEAVWSPPEIAPRGYGIDVEAVGDDGVPVTATTAFDVLERWTDHPRYGFLCDFGPERVHVEGLFDDLAQFHINGIQFYDWQYRHDDLLPPTATFEDPLGRQLSLATIVDLAGRADARGMAPMAYMAVYAASLDFWRQHPEWAMYDEEGEPLTFMDDFLGLMDPSPNRAWAKHILASCDRVLDELPFAGIHVDQYGEPRTAWDAGGKPIDLPNAFAGFVTALKQHHPEAPTTFNAVKNWPIESLIEAPMDFVYIEVWEETPYYEDLARIVDHAHRASGGQPVVIALYIPAVREENVLMANVVIMANGGSRIEFGEEGRLLTDPYFPLHEEMSPRLRTDLLRQHDFRVRYGELLSTATEPVSFSAESRPGVWVTARRSDDWLVAILVNPPGERESRWDNDHRAPTMLEDVDVRLITAAAVGGAFVASPDDEDPGLRPVDWTQSGDVVEVTVPSLLRMSMVALRIERP